MRLFLVCCVFFLFKLYAQESFFQPVSSTSLACYQSTIKGLDAMACNQAGVAYLNNTAISAVYHYKYMLKQLAIKSFMFAFPSSIVNVGLYMHHYGYNLYKDQLFSASFARKFGTNVAAGLAFKYVFVGIPKANTQNLVNFDMGLIYDFSDRLALGCYLQNIMPRFHNSSVILNYTNQVGVGLSYNFQPVWFLFEVKTSFHNFIGYCGGIEWKYNDNFTFRSGFFMHSIYNNGFSFGFTLKIKKIEISCSYNHHLILGNTPSIQLTYNFNHEN